MPIRIDPNIKDLRTRLKRTGFDWGFVQRHVLPDWWEDSLASVPSNRAIAEVAIARFFRFPIAALRDPARPLPMASVSGFRLKRSRRTTAEQLGPVVLVARRVAEFVAKSLPAMPGFRCGPAAAEVRRAILGQSRKVDLRSLVDICWDQGIVVLHIAPDQLPKGKRFQGIACLVGTIPVIILGFAGDSPPWLAFHLAHELGHICLGNVKSGEDPLVDSDIDRKDSDSQETSADRFATEVLTGKPEMHLGKDRRLTGPELAEAATRLGAKYAIDPGTVALIYGRSAGRFPVAQIALKRLGQHKGAREIIAEALSKHLDLSELPDSTARFLSCLSAVVVP